MVLFAPIAPEFKVNSNNLPLDTLTNPDVGVAANGNFVVVWEERQPVEGNNENIDIKFSIYDSDGDLLHTGDVASTEVNETQPSIAVADDGRFAIAYVKNDDIYAIRFSATGDKIGDDILLPERDLEKAQYDPDIAINSGELDPLQFTVVWTHQTEVDNADIRGRTISFEGSFLTSDLGYATDSDANEIKASIARTPVRIPGGRTGLGGALSYTRQSSNGRSSVYYTRMDERGTTFERSQYILVRKDGDDFIILRDQMESSVATDSEGNFVISFTGTPEGGGIENVYFRPFFSSGYSPIPVVLVDSSPDSQNNSQIALGNDGTIVVAYEDNSDNSIKYRQFNSDNEAISDSQNYDIDSDFEQNPALAISNNNTMVIVADDNATDNPNTFDPYARIYEPQLDTPFNRFRNKDVPGTYLFANEAESESIRANFPNFVEEGIAFYAYDADAQIATDFYRFRNTSQPGTYIFVAEAERESIINNFPNFVEEGVAFEAVL